jgi:peptide chain release factor 2
MNQTLQTVDEIVEKLRSLKEQLTWIEQIADPEGTRARIAELEQQMEAPDFWNDQKAAAKTGGEHTRAKRKLDNLAQLQRQFEDMEAMLEMANEGTDAERAEIVAELDRDTEKLDATLGQLQEDALFAGEYDNYAAVVSIHSGEGGVDAQDWAEMMLRMYSRFWEQRGFKVEMTSRVDGEEAGIKSTSLTVTGDNAYGVMNAEAGVHRLVRLSPFDSAHRRHTSFAQVEVYPYFEDDVEVEIDDKDLRIDTYRSSGAGGQHVNKTDSAIRITHLPTNTVVQCQNERSQHANKDTAMRMLKGKLFDLERQKRDAQIASEKGAVQNVGFGSQIRSYVLQPYQMVKDLRTRHETGNVQAVLDGALDDFIRAYLLQKAQES